MHGGWTPSNESRRLRDRTAKTGRTKRRPLGVPDATCIAEHSEAQDGARRVVTLSRSRLWPDAPVPVMSAAAIRRVPDPLLS